MFSLPCRRSEFNFPEAVRSSAGDSAYRFSLCGSILRGAGFFIVDFPPEMSGSAEIKVWLSPVSPGDLLSSVAFRPDPAFGFIPTCCASSKNGAYVAFVGGEKRDKLAVVNFSAVLPQLINPKFKGSIPCVSVIPNVLAGESSLCRSGSVISKVAWHPFSEHHLVVLTESEKIFVVDVSKNVETPEQTIPLLELMKGDRNFERNPIESFCFLHNEANEPVSIWSYFTVLLLHRDGLISVLAPLIPSNVHFEDDEWSELLNDVRSLTSPEASAWFRHMFSFETHCSLSFSDSRKLFYLNVIIPGTRQHRNPYFEIACISEAPTKILRSSASTTDCFVITDEVFCLNSLFNGYVPFPVNQRCVNQFDFESRGKKLMIVPSPLNPCDVAIVHSDGVSLVRFNPNIPDEVPTVHTIVCAVSGRDGARPYLPESNDIKGVLFSCFSFNGDVPPSVFYLDSNKHGLFEVYPVEPEQDDYCFIPQVSVLPEVSGDLLPVDIQVVSTDPNSNSTKGSLFHDEGYDILDKYSTVLANIDAVKRLNAITETRIECAMEMCKCLDDLCQGNETAVMKFSKQLDELKRMQDTSPNGFAEEMSQALKIISKPSVTERDFRLNCELQRTKAYLDTLSETYKKMDADLTKLNSEAPLKAGSFSISKAEYDLLHQRLVDITQATEDLNKRIQQQRDLLNRESYL